MNKKIICGLTILAVVVIVIGWFSRGYGEVSDNAYRLATATYGACLAQSLDRIERVELLLADEEFVAGMSGKEISWFESIFEQARNDDWTRAAQSARQMMEDQVVH